MGPLIGCSVLMMGRRSSSGRVARLTGGASGRSTVAQGRARAWDMSSHTALTWGLTAQGLTVGPLTAPGRAGMAPHRHSSLGHRARRSSKASTGGWAQTAAPAAASTGLRLAGSTAHLIGLTAAAPLDSTAARPGALMGRSTGSSAGMGPARTGAHHLGRRWSSLGHRSSRSAAAAAATLLTVAAAGPLTSRLTSRRSSSVRLGRGRRRTSPCRYWSGRGPCWMALGRAALAQVDLGPATMSQ